MPPDEKKDEKIVQAGPTSSESLNNPASASDKAVGLPENMTPVTVLASTSEDTTEELERAPAFGKKTARYYKVVLKNVYDKLDEFIPNIARDAELDSLLKNVQETMDLLFNDAKSFYEQNMERVLSLYLCSTSDYYCRKLNLPTSGSANAPAPTEVLDPVKAKLFENQLSYIDGLEAAWHDYRLSPPRPAVWRSR